MYEKITDVGFSYGVLHAVMRQVYLDVKNKELDREELIELYGKISALGCYIDSSHDIANYANELLVFIKSKIDAAMTAHTYVSPEEVNEYTNDLLALVITNRCGLSKYYNPKLNIDYLLSLREPENAVWECPENPLVAPVMSEEDLSLMNAMINQ